MTVPEYINADVLPDSVVAHGGNTYFLIADRGTQSRYLVVQGDASGFSAAQQIEGGATVYPLTAANAAALRARLPWLNPAPLGLAPSAGFGDRLGLATPGHIASCRGTGVAPIFAQQSVRENARTGRSPQNVVDDAMWAVFECGWRDPWGADADHLKTPDVVTPFVEAGYSFFTIDPSDHVDGAAHSDDLDTLRGKMAALPWDALQTSWDDLQARLLNQTIAIDDWSLTFREEELLRAAGKYGAAVAHIAMMYRHLRDLMGARPFDFEVSVDETETPTTPHEHYYVAVEMQRLGVTWVSLAPRFVGRFEKGVDFIGDLDALDQNLAQHSSLARHFGGYKLSLHSGSDKFSVYPLAAKHARGLVHLKTAGTSYLEALRVIGAVEPGMFREILAFSRGRYDEDRATYHVSARLDKVPAPESLSDADLPGLLDQFDARQVLHVTYGSALDRWGEPLKAALIAHADAYAEGLRVHFDRHLSPFVEAV